MTKYTHDFKLILATTFVVITIILCAIYLPQYIKPSDNSDAIGVEPYAIPTYEATNLYSIYNIEIISEETVSLSVYDINNTLVAFVYNNNTYTSLDVSTDNIKIMIPFDKDTPIHIVLTKI